MEKQRSKNALLIWVLLAGLVSHNMVMLVASRNLEEGFNDQKHYYSPYPHTSPPKGESLIEFSFSLEVVILYVLLNH